MSAWTDHVERWKDCTECPLCQQRDRIVLVRGSIDPCDVLFIGEAPGASEDATGRPFDGPAGHLLDQIIERALPKTTRFALTNLVACFPAEAKATGNHQPRHDEIISCRERLDEFINIARPRLIVCVGSLATEYVSHDDIVSCIDIVHPSYILSHMPRAQQQMAVQKCIVQISSAVGDMLASRHHFTKWGDKNASSKSQFGEPKWYTCTGDEIPF